MASDLHHPNHSAAARDLPIARGESLVYGAFGLPALGAGPWAGAASSTVPNKANFPCFWAQNVDRVKKQSQSKPIWVGKTARADGGRDAVIMHDKQSQFPGAENGLKDGTGSGLEGICLVRGREKQTQLGGTIAERRRSRRRAFKGFAGPDLKRGFALPDIRG